jgi:hypothetical protein
MTLTIRAACDWDGNNFFAFNASPSDAANNYDTSNLANSFLWFRQITGTGASIATQTTVTEYGSSYLRWTTGTSTTATFDLGYNGSSYSFTLGANSSARFTIWVRSRNASYDALNLSMSMYKTGAVNLGTVTKPVVYANGWTQFTVTALNNTAGSVNVYIHFNKTHSTSAIYDVAGLVYSSGTGGVDGYNCGDVSRYENITAWVMDARWNVGFRDAYQHVADDNKLTLTLLNSGFEWTPELGLPNPIAGNVKPNRRVKVQIKNPALGSVAFGTVDSLYINMWDGWLHTIAPKAVAKNQKTAVLAATSARRFMTGYKADLALLESVNVSAILTAALAALTLPSGVSLDTDIDSGVYTYPYAFDNVETEENKLGLGPRTGTEPKDLLAVIRMCAEAERGRVFFDRSGTFTFWNRAVITNAGSQSLLATYTNSIYDADYVYGDHIINDVKAAFYKRKLSAAADRVLWELDSALVVNSGETKVIRASYSDEGKNKRVGAKTVTHAVTYGGGGGIGVTITLSPGATSCKITIVNGAGVARTIATLQLLGQKITAWNRAEVQSTDSTSISDYGDLPLVIDNELTASDLEAKAIADWEVARHKDPRGRLRSIKYIPRDSTMEQEVVERTVGNRIHVTDSSTDSSGRDYLIIGEEHNIVGREGVLFTTWYLEPIL